MGLEADLTVLALKVASGQAAARTQRGMPCRVWPQTG